MPWKNSYHKTGRYFSEIDLTLEYIVGDVEEVLIITKLVTPGKAKSPLCRIWEGYHEAEAEYAQKTTRPQP